VDFGVAGVWGCGLLKGKSWSVAEVRMLRDLVVAELGLDEVCDSLDRSRDSVKSKMNELGLRFSKVASGGGEAGGLELADDLPSLMDKLRVHDAAARALEQPGLPVSEVLRLRTIMRAAFDYGKMYADFVNYRGLELQVAELRRELAGQKKVGDSKAS
jgi:hypothetical protein